VNFQTERKIETNRWVIKARWLYFLVNLVIISLVALACHSNLHFPIMMGIFTLIFVFSNVFFYVASRRFSKTIQKQTSDLEQESRLRTIELKQLTESRTSLQKALNELHYAKDRAEEEKNKTLAIVSNFTDPIIVLNKENLITLFNLAAKLSLGLRNDDLGREVLLKDDFGLKNFKDVIRKKFEFKKMVIIQLRCTKF